MTAVVGLLNRRGVAIAADSAVTRTRGRDQKVTKNGNKMVRVSDAVPISVMITGNADFMRNPWDVIVRRYRKARAGTEPATVEECVEDFFRYLSECDALWDTDSEHGKIAWTVFNKIFCEVYRKIDSEVERRDDKGRLRRPKAYEKGFRAILAQIRKQCRTKGMSQNFADLTAEEFAAYVRPDVEQAIKELEDDDNIAFGKPKSDPEVAARNIDEVMLTLRDILTTADDDESAVLVFSGYGASEEYPSLVAVEVTAGFCRRANYVVRDVVRISDERPAAICPYAQRDVVDALLGEVNYSWLRSVRHDLANLFGEELLPQFESIEDPEAQALLEAHNSWSAKVPWQKFNQEVDAARKANIQAWTKALEQYDVRSMAALAQSLIDLTGFQRILTFQTEGVGGDVDLAIITRNEGFTWLNRKSWYHHRDIGGRYGSMGV